MLLQGKYTKKHYKCVHIGKTYILVGVVTKYDRIEIFTKISCQTILWIIRITSGLLLGLLVLKYKYYYVILSSDQ